MNMDVGCAGTFQPLYLDVYNREQVFSPSMVDVFIGNPANHMLIFAGVAAPAWNTEDDDLRQAEVIINLRTPIINVIAQTAVIGLASIGNGDSDFIFATDEVQVVAVNGNLELHACIAVQGDPSDLNRFSYQANVIVNIDEPLITGTVRWNKQYTPDANPLFTVHASVQGSDGTFYTYTPVAQDTGTLPLTPVGDVYAFAYAIRNVPLQTPLYITLDDVMQANFSLPSGGVLIPQQASGPSQPITLTPLNMNVTNLDFKLVHEECFRYDALCPLC